jgi:hypothetical protein
MAQMEHIHLIRPAETRHGLHQRIEHGLEVDGGTADDLEHLGGRGLLLQGLIQLTSAAVKLILQVSKDGAVTAYGLCRTAVHRRFLASRFNRFAACFVATSHCLPEAPTDDS